MNPIMLLEISVLVLVAAILITQIIVPIWKGTPLFPIFRKSRKQVEAELRTARGSLEEATIRRETSEVRQRAKETQRGGKPTPTHFES